MSSVSHQGIVVLPGTGVQARAASDVGLCMISGAANDSDRARRFRDLALPHLDEVYTLARYLLRDAGDAEDAVQECFLRALKHLDSWRGPAIRPWLFAILRNVVIDEARARGVRPVPQDSEVQEAVADLVDPLEQALDAWLIEEALRRIRPEHRTVIVETYYRGRPYADVAADLGIPEGTARSRAFYGLRALRLALEEMGWEG